MTYRRCPGCAHFYDKKLGPCPECGQPAGVYSSHMDRVKLDNHLWGQAASAYSDQQKYKALQKGYDLPPSREQKRIARQIVSDYM